MKFFFLTLINLSAELLANHSPFGLNLTELTACHTTPIK
jgi:hypothetical protein